MLEKVIENLVTWCSSRPYVTLVLSFLLTIVAGIYVSNHFQINTDTSNLISNRLPWRQREIAFDQAFPQLERFYSLIPTPSSKVVDLKQPQQ